MSDGHVAPFSGRASKNNFGGRLFEVSMFRWFVALIFVELLCLSSFLWSPLSPYVAELSSSVHLLSKVCFLVLFVILWCCLCLFCLRETPKCCCLTMLDSCDSRACWRGYWLDQKSFGLHLEVWWLCNVMLMFWKGYCGCWLARHCEVSGLELNLLFLVVKFIALLVFVSLDFCIYVC